MPECDVEKFAWTWDKLRYGHNRRFFYMPNISFIMGSLWLLKGLSPDIVHHWILAAYLALEGSVRWVATATTVFWQGACQLWNTLHGKLPSTIATTSYMSFSHFPRLLRNSKQWLSSILNLFLCMAPLLWFKKCIVTSKYLILSHDGNIEQVQDGI